MTVFFVPSDCDQSVSVTTDPCSESAAAACPAPAAMPSARNSAPITLLHTT